MVVPPLKSRIRDALWQVVDRHAFVVSATLTGSFAASGSLEGISDIDFVVIVDRLDAASYMTLVNELHAALEPELHQAGFGLRINPTLGPLKFNDARTAVLHLMLYSQEAHVEHVIDSPFTCLDWQRAGDVRGRRMADVFPVFGLQPRHFLSARRSPRDYLADFDAGVISYRALSFQAQGYSEERRQKPMDARDRHEYAWHVLRFLMQNLVKLVGRQNSGLAGQALLEAYFELFPAQRDTIEPFYQALAQQKAGGDFSRVVPHLGERLREFVACFETQFQSMFVDTATRHLVFRHAATDGNRDVAGGPRFLGRLDPAICPVAQTEQAELLAAIAATRPTAVYSSPLQRCVQSLQALTAGAPRSASASPGEFRLPKIKPDELLLEIDYGAADGLTVQEARFRYPQLFADWECQRDPKFPGGECTADVVQRVRRFTEARWTNSRSNTLVCTHNVVLRCLVGTALQVPPAEWHRLRIPHLAPIEFVQTRKHGLFVNLAPGIHQEIFRDFLPPSAERHALRAAG